MLKVMAITSAPANVAAELDKAASLDHDGNTREANQRLARLCEQFPDEPAVWLQRALLLDRISRERDAIDHYRRALVLGLSEDDERVAVVCLASSYRNIGRHEDARAVLVKGRRRFPRDPVVESFYALTLHDLGQSASALRILGMALVDTANPGTLRGFDETLRTKFRGVTHRAPNASSTPQSR